MVAAVSANGIYLGYSAVGERKDRERYRPHGRGAAILLPCRALEVRDHSMSKNIIVACLVGLLGAATTQAAESSNSAASAFIKCARIASDGQRLLCYDRLATELIELGLTSRGGLPAASAPAASPAEATASAPSATAATPAAQEAAQEAAPQTTAAASSVDKFGSERVEDDANLKKIQSRYVGEFTGWDGKTRFELENGQVWEQAESGRWSHRAMNPMITIKRGFLGSYILTVDEYNTSVRVKRLK